MSTSRMVSSVAAALGVAVLASPPAHAQDAPPFDSSIDLELFDYSPGPKSFMSVSSAEVVDAGKYALDFFITFLTDPFTIYVVDETNGEIASERTAVVEDLLAGQIAGAYGLTDRLQLGLSLPLVFSMRGEGIDPASGLMDPNGLQASGVGDLYVELKLRAWQSESGGLKLGAAAGLSVPTSVGTEGGDFLGDNLPDGRVRGMLQWTSGGGRLEAGLNAGLILRKPRTVYASEVGQQLSYGAATAYHITDRFSLIAEVFGRAGLPSLAVEDSPLEAVGGARIGVTPSVSLLIGGGGGLLEGIGSPALRAFAAISYAPGQERHTLVSASNDHDTGPDKDGDHRDDAEDRCPTQPEDLDGFEDEDGCPELDNDKDGLADLKDRCPAAAEDGKKPFDKDGCPADQRDSDDDGSPDSLDKCPEDQEDVDEFEDWDGCPDKDNDKDGVADDSDSCQLCSEDKDGFEDGDGCPEFDNDKDGVADAKDKCPTKAETVNGVSDFDGCPDTGGRQVARMEGDKILVDVAIEFKRNKLSSKSEADQVAAVMFAHPEVSQWRIVVAVKAKGSDTDKAKRNAQIQAEALRAHLASRGIARERIEAVGAGSDRDLIAFVALERSETSGDAAQFTCPADRTAKPRPAPAGTIAPEPTDPPPGEPADSTSAE